MTWTMIPVEEVGSSEEVGVRVEVVERRKVSRKGRFGNGRAAAGRFDVEEVIRQLRSLSEEDRGRCMRAFAAPSGGWVSSLSDGLQVELLHVLLHLLMSRF